MKRFFCVVALILPLLAFGPGYLQAARVFEGVVTKVSDGDTLHLTSSGTRLKVRLYGIDAPERHGQPHGEEAFKALQGKVLSRTVRLDAVSVDRYKRIVGIIWIQNRNVNREMVAEGHAWAYRRYLDRPYASEFIDAEAKARAAKTGLWQQANPLPPWEFRRKGY